MAKATTIKVKLNSTADTGFYYVTKKNSRTMTEKLSMKKYDPIARKHVPVVALFHPRVHKPIATHGQAARRALYRQADRLPAYDGQHRTQLSEPTPLGA